MYNDVTDSWMIPQNDPYTLENFQKAYDNLASGKSLQTLTRAEASEFSEDEKLAPTHFALRIYPRNEEEQWKVEMMEDVNVVYAPFGYSGLTEGEVERVPQTRTEIPSPFEVSPYTVTYEEYESTDDSQVGSRTIQLPILYAVWPADKSLPDDLEYKVDYEVYLPYVAPATRSAEALITLHDEAQMQALGYLIPTPVVASNMATRAPSAKGFHLMKGRLITTDMYLSKIVPLSYLVVSVQLGTNIIENLTDNEGYFSTVVYLSTNPGNGDEITLPFTITYKGSYYAGYYPYRPSLDGTRYWNITTETYPTTPCTQVISGTLGTYGSTTIVPSTARGPLLDIHRAANYFFFQEQYAFPPTRPTIPGGINIVAHGGSGRCAFSWHPLHSANPFIKIYAESNPSSTVGAVLHELGHFAHYQYNRPQYVATPKIFKESFASYSGWFLGEAYLSTLGWVNNPTYYPEYEDVTRQGQQGWYYMYDEEYAWYSPLFIDLTDDYNQYDLDTLNPDDEITGVPASVIWDIITNTTTWEECKSQLRSYIGTYYTQAELNNNIFQFEVWFATHHTLDY